MSSQSTERNLFERYLEILGVHHAKPELTSLKELVAAQLFRVSYETISKLYYFKRQRLIGMPDFGQYLNGIEEYHFGGTCYSNNYYFYRLLEYLSFEVKLCEADMTEPGVHVVSIVRVDGKEYLVDVGYAAPFSAPMPRDLPEEYTITLGRDRYILKPQDENRCSRIEMYRNGKPKQGYLVKPVARRIQDFRKVIEASYREDARFMKSILLARFYPNHSTVLYNRTLAESDAAHSELRKLANHDEVASSIEKRFGISKGIVLEVISHLSLDGSD